ncbi:aryl-sulfate sulfotransferase [Fulvivirga sedimenti]|uniref:Aryl-sulfate sulfotransferase n=1 Tax=Fulvivirga sedimenti TaxID=2879465 RepID=A0A9X1HLL9_9BACT|nr:aryl-sulfate sulfotransferase [Fulvivirga sedimenti]MCA6074499.1 aryl-sulfate sulfotransferase [Fulvivirga sedimenti]MCA6075676.1 aryl-sulfate sulfotransferase [Fulvivirga sedimenti]MCA6076804.1 aryl-sulfate sulfotransferase [Fulvivirga sedimenti]
MKKFLTSVTCAFLAILLMQCNNATTEPVSSGEESDTTKYDQNMFGHFIPRGLITKKENLTDGYAMFAVANSPSVYLVNRDGQVVHEWKGNYFVLSPYLLPDGSIMTNASDPDFPVFAGGGEMGRIQKISWDGEMLWDFEYATEEYLHHHDIAVMPNGNVLAIAWTAKTAEEAIAAGRKPEFTPEAGLWPDKIIEIKPTDRTHGEIVWEWHVWDHMIQDYDPSKKNYGNPAEHPELLDINASGEEPNVITADSLKVLRKMERVRRNTTVENDGSDVYHFNAINYNAELDQIIFSSPNLSEVFIIDHSTTTEEAAGHTGGKMGKGGDFLYRWGNPENYQRGDSTDRRLYHQHDVRWVEKGYPGDGNITVYNNDIPSNRKDSLHYSAIYEITPPVDNQGNYVLGENGRFGPAQPSWVYVAPDTVSFFGGFISGAHRMPNGNTFINEGPRARFMEVTAQGDLLWEYLSPYRGKITKSNGDPVNPMPMTHSTFRSTFISADDPGLQGRELKPLDPQPETFVMPKPPKEEKEKEG